LREQEVGEDLLPGVGVRVGVQLHQRLRLVVRQPDGLDGLQLDEGDGQVGDPVARQAQHRQPGDMAHLTRDPAVHNMDSITIKTAKQICQVPQYFHQKM
jgi:hypothetical protein